MRTNAAEPVKTGRQLLMALSLLFLLSGASGLIYQVLWMRQLTLVFGVTVYAASTVLSSFMAGLALGSLLAGRLADRASRPLLWYALIEVLIGLSALATPAALKAADSFYRSIYSGLDSGLATLTLVRFICSFMVLLVPTTLMGATLPVIVKSSLFRGAGVGRRAGLLYASNTAGAIAGTLLAGFYLIGSLGISASFKLAAALNVAVGVMAMAIALGAGNRAVAVAASSEDRREKVANLGGGERARRLVLIVFALSGFVSLALEVVWFRLLVLYFEVTTYAFTIMLAAVLCGITLGSYLVTPLLGRRWNWLAALAVIEMAIAVACLLSLASLALTPAVLSWAGPALERSFGAGLAIMMVASFLAIFPATLLMGIAFPIGLSLWAGGRGDGPAHAAERVGAFYSLNLFCAILGSIAGGFFLLPGLGSRASLISIAAVSLASGLALLIILPAGQRGFAPGAGAAGVALFLAAVLTMPDPFSIILAHRYPGDRLLWREEGAQTTASVHEKDTGTRVMYLDGVHQAEDSREVVTIHRQIGLLPVALSARPESALVIGLGGGVTAGALSQAPGLEVDVVELSETVTRGTGWFSHVNYDVLGRPNLRLRIDDGRSFLRLNPKRYDIITADIIRPFHAGSGNLYSAEYFQLARYSLKENGLMLQWNGSWSETQYKLVLRTFLSVFPNTTLWAGGTLMVGSPQPLALDEAEFERKLTDARFGEALKSIGIASFESLLSLYTAGPDQLRSFAGPGPVLTDDKPRIEYFLSLPANDRKVDTGGLGGDVRRHIRRPAGGP